MTTFNFPGRTMTLYTRANVKCCNLYVCTLCKSNISKWKKAVSIQARNNMEPSREIPLIFIGVLLIGTTRGNHFLRGCQDVDPKCAILDEMRAAGGMYVQFNSERRDEWHKRS